MMSKFKVGDRVYKIRDLWKGHYGVVERVEDGLVWLKLDNGKSNGAEPNNIVLANQIIVIYTNGNETIATLKQGKEVVRTAKAKCHPGDEFNFEIGAKLAFERLMDRDKQLELKISIDGKEIAKAVSSAIINSTNSSFDWDGFKQGKFAVHCDTEEKAKAFLKECDEQGIKWFNGKKASEFNMGVVCYCCFRSNSKLEWCQKKFYEKVGKQILDYAPSKPAVKEVNRQAKSLSDYTERELLTELLRMSDKCSSSMNENVLNILNLCLHAKSMGHNVWFNYAPHVQEIEVYAFDEKWNFELDEEPDFLFKYRVCLSDNPKCVNNIFENMETTILKLINGEFE